MNNNILVVGSLAYDYIMNFDGKFKDHIMPDKVHILNVSFTAKKLQKEFGGTAGNIAYNLNLLQQKPYIVAAAGSDFNEYKKWFSDNKISTKYISILKDQYTASAHIITDQDDNQITSFHGGAMLCKHQSIAQIIKDTKPKLAILAPNSKEATIDYSHELTNNNISFIFDPGQMIIAFNKFELIDLFSNSYVSIFNDYEMQLFTDRTGISIDKAAEMVDYLIITLGSKGSSIYHHGNKHEIPAAKPINTDDPTGAGDAYRSGIILGLINNWEIEQMGKVAALASVYTVEKYGTQTHKYSISDFKKRYQNNFNKELTI